MHPHLVPLVLGFIALAAGICNAENPAQVMALIQEEYVQSFSEMFPQGSCTAEKVGIRREWNRLSNGEKADYLRAVKCLQAKPSIANGTIARTRYEEFVLSHISQTLRIHFSGLLLPWHRYYVWLHEQALRSECGYSGYQPYWNWSKYIADPHESTIFRSSTLSFGDNGKAIPHGTTNVTLPGGPPPPTHLIQPAGSGGGCVSEGPFANLSLSLDATNRGASTPIEIFRQQRCLKRDFNMNTLAHQNSYRNVTDLILNYTDIAAFHAQLEDPLGVHTGGHAFIGGENFNLFTSPSDPVFFLHHATVDRVWAIWQSRDFNGRRYALTGTSTWENYPPSPKVTLNDTLEMAPLHPAKIMDVMSTINGILCYRYE